MSAVLLRAKSFLVDEAGVSVIEYGLLGSLIVVVAVTSITATGTDVAALWNRVASRVMSAIAGG